MSKLQLTAVNTVIGKVISVHPHPNGNRIRLARVLFSHQRGVTQIVFGGRTNVVKPGCFIPVAPPTKSCRVQGKKARRQKIRGEFSYGELLSLYELGLVQYDTDQVAIFRDEIELKVGAPVSTIMHSVNAQDDLWGIFKPQAK